MGSTNRSRFIRSRYHFQATLRDGRLVAVKVQHRHAARQIPVVSWYFLLPVGLWGCGAWDDRMMCEHIWPKHPKPM